MHVGKYSIAKFIDDARLILKTGDALEAKKSAIGERMVELSRRDDLLRTGFMLGPNDTTPHNWMLWQEPGMSLHVAGLFPGHTSAVHEHGDFWAVGCGYRGCDRWDMYQRFDDGSQPGYADVRMVDQYEVSPGKAVWMPPPPRAIHSHNNASATEFSYELLFFAADSPPPPEERLIYDIDEKKCWPSPYNFRPVFTGEYYPPRPVARRGLFSGLEGLWQGAKVAAGGAGRAMFCPVCHSLSAR